jgi:hypothetical protein
MTGKCVSTPYMKSDATQSVMAAAMADVIQKIKCRTLMILKRKTVAISSATDARNYLTVGNGRKPMLFPPQLGCCNVAPLLPQAVQRARWLSTSLDAFGPQRMTNGARAAGA